MTFNRTASTVILSGAKDPMFPAVGLWFQPEFAQQSSVIPSEASAKRSEALAQGRDPSPKFSGRKYLTRIWAPIIIALLLSAFASAQTLTGTVKNSTTGKPASGDDVVLLTLGQGMQEAGRTKADSKGNFSFKLSEQGPHLVRAIHQGVTYHRMAPPGTTSVEVEVYDVGKQVQGIEVVADVMRLQAVQGQLNFQRIFAVENNSKPPRTQMNDRNLEFVVPDGAKMIRGSALTQGGNPLNSDPVPQDDKKTRYAFLFPLRPGTTQFEVEYEVPYNGNASIDPKSFYSLQHFVAIIPKTMQFSAASDTNFKQMNDPQQPDANVQVASSAQAGQHLSFQISGEGSLGDRQQNAGAPSEPGGGGGQQADRPGGGLGPPIDAPDPLQKYRWWILAAFAAALVGGGIYVASRQQAAQRAARAGGGFSEIEDAEDFEVPAPPKPSRQPAAKPRPAPIEAPPAAVAPRNSSKLLEGLKDELFELEVEHKQGRISQEEYDRTKAALDQTLQRALKRESQKA